MTKKEARKIIDTNIALGYYSVLNYSQIVKHLTNDELVLLFLDSDRLSISFWAKLSEKPNVAKYLL